MATSAPSSYSLNLRRVLGPSPPKCKNWYAVSSEWSYRPNRETVASTVAPFNEEIAEISIHKLVDCIGAKADPSWFGSARKKDMVVVSTLFGILAKAVQSKNPKED